ncbi:MAG: MaoC family dehydratase N-terminal domain-containing protein [Deltaproteobacteria bacterium]|nr:MaoC family dehydratase N-terminal domain-containing protein [Deltaproteobacteria bacterium]
MAFNLDVIGKTFGPSEHEYTEQDVILYALGCGAGIEELDLLYEARGPKVLPTFAVVPAYKPLHESLIALGGNMLTLVHGAQRVTIHRSIPARGTVLSSAKIGALYDKGKGALAVISTSTRNGAGELLFETEWQIFYRGEGGFGGERGPDAPPFGPPEGKAADVRLEMPTQPTQAALYRLGSHDLNPIHIDPQVATKVGFKNPILHGLCTFAHAGRAAILGLCAGDPEKLVSLEGRFSKPVTPGDTIVTELYSVGPGEAYFVSSVNPKDPVITLGRVTYRS